MDPSSLKFTKSHEWVGLDGDVATIGISDFAVRELTDLVYIQLPKVGAAVEAGKPFGEVESVKAVSDLYAPVSGQITAVNESLTDDLSQLSDDPFGKGWIAKVQVAGMPAGLMDHAAYKQFCAAGGH